MNFVYFRQNSIFCSKKKYTLKNVNYQESFFFQQLVMNFVSYWQNSIYGGGEGLLIEKHFCCKKHSCLDSCKFFRFFILIAFLCKKV